MKDKQPVPTVTFTVRIPADLGARLSRAAARRGISPTRQVTQYIIACAQKESLR